MPPSIIVHRKFAFERVPRQMFEVAMQAAIGNRIVAREAVRALRKNALARYYGGDISRKRRLVENRRKANAA